MFFSAIILTIRKRIVLVMAVLLISGTMYAQQSMQISQYMLNKYQFNAAYAGMDYSLSITGLNRKQWAGFDGQPISQNLNAHMPLYMWNGAAGISIENDKLGALSSTMASVSFNYVYDTEIALLSAGARLGWKQIKIDGTELRTPDGEYGPNTFQHNDPILPGTRFSGSGPIWELAAYMIYGSIEGGISLTNLPGHRIHTGDVALQQEKLLQVYMEYNHSLNDLISLSSVFLMKTNFVSFQTDLGVLAKYQRKYFAGAGLRGYNRKSFDAVVFIAGLQFNKNYKLSYSYDFGINSLNIGHEGSHEFILNYNLNKLIGAGLPPKVIYNPRFL